MGNRIFFVVACFLASGCPRHLTPPASFYELDRFAAGYDQRATSADGIVIANRIVRAASEGSLSFWSDAIKQHVTRVRGYALTSETQIRSASGHDGRLLRFGHDEADGAYAYWLVVYVDGRDVHVLEAGGKQERVDAAQAELEQSILGYDI